jgi:uncharacterized protein (TIGR02453 family)
MPSTFPGFPPSLLTFFRSLEKNNRRDWFTPRKEIFETQIRAPMIELVTLLNDRFRHLAPNHVADEPAKLLYRIYRDTRFSHDKTPYKTHIGATFHHRLFPRHAGTGYYFEISHKFVGIAGGIYMPGPDELLALRTALAKHPDPFLKLAAAKSLTRLFGTLQGERLARLPKPFQSQADSPAADFLKLKQLFWWVELPADLATTPRLFPTLLKHFETLVPAMTWLDQTLLAARKNSEDPQEPLRPPPMW